MDDTIRSTADVREHIGISHHPLMSWRSVVAGLLIAFLSYLILMSLGAGIGASSLVGVINSGDTTAGNNLAVGAGIWVLLATFISLLVGSYFAARISHFISGRVGSAQGIVISALFFGFMIFSATSTVGTIGGGLNSLIGTLGTKSEDLLKNPQVQSTNNRSLGDVNHKHDPDVVAQGIAVRLLRSDTEGAKNYFAFQANMTRPEVDVRFEQLKNDFNTTVKNAGAAAAKGASAAGWGLFVTLVVGTFFASLGGSMGARANLRKPIADEETTGQTALYPRTV